MPISDRGQDNSIFLELLRIDSEGIKLFLSFVYKIHSKFRNLNIPEENAYKSKIIYF